MKFACDHCGRKYVLADEKIAAKQDVRLKCRQCGQVVVVKQAGEMVARSPATPVPRLPTAEGALPPPAMPPPFKRPSSRAAPIPLNGEHEGDGPVHAAVVEAPLVTAPDLQKISAAGPSSPSGGATPPPPRAEWTSAVDAYSETIAEQMPPSATGLPRAPLPRPSRRPPRRASPASGSVRPAQPATQTPSAVEPVLSEPATQQPAEDGADRAAAVEPGPIASLANKEQLAPGGQSRGANAAGLALVVQLVDRLWLGASGSDEKRRMLIVLGVGFMLGTLFGLVF